MLKNSKKILTAVALVGCMLTALISAESCAAQESDDGVVYIQPVAEKSFMSDDNNVVLTIGEWDQFTVNLKTSGIKKFAEGNNNCGVNNYTLFLTYDPDVVRLTGIKGPTQTEVANDYVYYSAYGYKIPLYDENSIKSNFDYAPSASNSQYTDVGADGVKTCVELGKIKMGYLLSNTDASGRLLTVTNDGTLIGFTFRAVGEGDAKIAVGIYDYAGGFSSAPYSEKEIKTVALDSNIYIRDISTGGQTGDMDFDGKITRTDATLLLEHLMKKRELSWRQLQYADVTGSGIDMRDIIAILKMCS